MTKSSLITHIGKVLLAMVLISGLVVVAARDIAPHVPIRQVLLTVGGAGLALAILLVAVAIAQAHWGQFALRKGATDTQWLWFPGGKNPPGLQQLLDERDAQARRGTRDSRLL